MAEESKSARDKFIEAAFWHGELAKANAILAAHREIAGADIFTAVMLGDNEAVRRFIAADQAQATTKGGPRNVDPLTYLCFSTYLRNDPPRSDAFVSAATMLLDAGADPNTGFFDPRHQPEPTKETVLYAAAGVAHHAGVTRLLLERGADPNDGEVAYHAPEGWDNDALRALLESGKLSADSLTTMLARKADWHDLEGMRLVLDHGVEVNRMSHWGKTALHNAILSNNSLAIIDLLLDRGADPSIVAKDLRHGGEFRTGRSSSALAARRGRADVLASIERRGIQLELDPLDTLIAACARGDAVSARALIARDHTLHGQLLDEGSTLIAEFAGSNNAEGVGLLIDLGVPIDARYMGDPYMGIAKDSTALHVAAWRAWHDVVELLIARGADLNARNAKNETPLRLAVRAAVDSYWMIRRSPRSVKALLDAGATREGVTVPTGYIEIDALLA
jgi:ankyrin repeat protein